jgi:hypothetical protein
MPTDIPDKKPDMKSGKIATRLTVSPIAFTSNPILVSVLITTAHLFYYFKIIPSQKKKSTTKGAKNRVFSKRVSG